MTINIGDGDPFLQFDSNDNIPLCQISDETLKKHLLYFLKIFCNTTSTHGSGIYGPSHLDYMVDHGLAHSKDVWIIANRFLARFPDLLKNLNDYEKFTISLSIWLHDIGMSKKFSPLDTLDDNSKIKLINSLNKKLNIKIDFNTLRDNLRKYHSLLSWHYINNPTADLSPYVSVHLNDTIISKDIIRCIAIISLYHQSNWPIEKLYEKNMSLGNPLVEIYPNGYTIGNTIINIIFLSLLLEFFDECDQLLSRLKDAENRETDNITRASSDFNKITKNVNNFLQYGSVDKTNEIRDKILKCKDLYFETNDISAQKILEFEEILINNTLLQDKIRLEWENYKELVIETHNHYISKQIIDIIFQKNKIILIVEDEYNVDYINEYLDKIKKCYEILKKNSEKNYKKDILPIFSHELKTKHDLINESDSADIMCETTNKEVFPFKNEMSAKKRINNSNNEQPRLCKCSLNNTQDCLINGLSEGEVPPCFQFEDLTYPIYIFHKSQFSLNKPFNIEIEIDNVCYILSDEIHRSYNLLLDAFVNKNNSATIYNGLVIRYLSHQFITKIDSEEIVKIKINAMRDFYFNSIVSNYSLNKKIYSSDQTLRYLLFNGVPNEIKVNENFGNIFGFAMNVITSDGHILYSQRGATVAVESNLYDVGVSGAFSYIKDLINSNTINVRNAILRELNEELGLDSDDVKDVVYTGLIFNIETWKPEIVGLIQLKINSLDLRSKLSEQSAKDRFEHQKFFLTKNEKNYVYNILKSHNWAPHFAAALILGLENK